MIIFHWVLECFLVNGKYSVQENKRLFGILENHSKLLSILQREIRKQHQNGHEFNYKYSEYELLFLKKEIFTTEILMECLDFMLINNETVVHFCKKYGLNGTKFWLRLTSVGVEFDNDELEILETNNIIHIK